MDLIVAKAEIHNPPALWLTPIALEAALILGMASLLASYLA